MSEANGSPACAETVRRLRLVPAASVYEAIIEADATTAAMRQILAVAG
jgi:hypothetical protein